MKNIWNKFTDIFGYTILHPQFIVNNLTKEGVIKAKILGKDKRLIDIGCGRMPYKKELEKTLSSYTGLDHPHISKLYSSTADIYADVGKKLPIKNNSYDIALLFEVMEYLEDPLFALSEIRRILVPHGVLIISSPFLYSIHDILYDRNRFTKLKLLELLNESGFKETKTIVQGSFIGFWFLSANVFLLKRIMDILKTKKNITSIIYLLFLIIITPPIVVTLNTIHYLIKDIKMNYSNYFPLNYLIVTKK